MAMGDEFRSADGSASARRFDIEGESLGFPSLYPDGSSAVGLFMASSSGAQELIRDSGFEVAELLPGRAAFSLACVTYRESDCGIYNEISLAFFVKPKHGRPNRIPYLGTWLDIARGDAATYVWKLPVTSKLANDAGVLMWGFPKTIEEIEFERIDGRAVFTLRMGGREVLSYSVEASGHRHLPRSASAVYTLYEGAPQVSFLESECHEVAARAGGGRLELGDHPVADTLRDLGISRRPVVSTWMGRTSFWVGPPQKL
jgi:hypothetical protein